MVMLKHQFENTFCPKNEHEIWQRTQLTRRKSLWASLGQNQNGKDFLQRLVSAPSKGNTWKNHIWINLDGPVKQQGLENQKEKNQE